MIRPSSRMGLFLGISCLALALTLSGQQPENIPGTAQARKATRDLEKLVAQDQTKLARPKTDWAKIRADATRLRDLARRIDEQLQEGPDRLPATLPRDLKEVQSLAKRLQGALGL